MTTEPIGLYVHIPFCKKKCAYCDFVSFEGALAQFEERYIQALTDEIVSYKRDEKIAVDTVFFGGGTPSLISADSFVKIVNSIKEVFEILPDAEFSVESNPKTLTEEKLTAYKKCGVNRISFGLQSIHEKELKILGRIHNFEEFSESYNMVLKSGIDNINVDLMYAIPEQTVHSFCESLKKVISLAPTHISAYSLILEEGTRLYNERDKLALPSEDEECEMYYAASEILRSNGYDHYEISNYAKLGYECRHNLKYWQDKEYIGLGLAAHSYLFGKRYSNTVEFSEYFASDRKKYIRTETITERDNAYEYAMMNLRLANGFSLAEYKKRFGFDFKDGKNALISKLITGGYIGEKDGKIFLTEKGFYVSNTILSELL